jgi:hypothetical protein
MVPNIGIYLHRIMRCIWHSHSHWPKVSAPTDPASQTPPESPQWYKVAIFDEVVVRCLWKSISFLQHWRASLSH